MVTACLIPPSQGRGMVFFPFLLVYHGCDGARTPRRSHHGRDRLGKMKNKSMHYSSRPRGEGKVRQWPSRPTVTGVIKRLGRDSFCHGREQNSGCSSPCHARP